MHALNLPVGANVAERDGKFTKRLNQMQRFALILFFHMERKRIPVNIRKRQHSNVTMIRRDYLSFILDNLRQCQTNARFCHLMWIKSAILLKWMIVVNLHASER